MRASGAELQQLRASCARGRLELARRVYAVPPPLLRAGRLQLARRVCAMPS